jgi:hypothetical protein
VRIELPRRAVVVDVAREEGQAVESDDLLVVESFPVHLGAHERASEIIGGPGAPLQDVREQIPVWDRSRVVLDPNYAHDEGRQGGWRGTRLRTRRSPASLPVAL